MGLILLRGGQSAEGKLVRRPSDLSARSVAKRRIFRAPKDLYSKVELLMFQPLTFSLPSDINRGWDPNKPVLISPSKEGVACFPVSYRGFSASSCVCETWTGALRPSLLPNSERINNPAKPELINTKHNQKQNVI